MSGDKFRVSQCDMEKRNVTQVVKTPPQSNVIVG